MATGNCVLPNMSAGNRTLKEQPVLINVRRLSSPVDAVLYFTIKV